MQRLVEKLQQYWSDVSSSKYAESILDTDELQKIQQLAINFPFDLIDSDKEQAQALIGDALSVFYGQGLEFEENRLYTPGDDPRFINWRLMARTGEMYSKVFRESRRPQVFIIVDRRAGMHFGTRKQLKLTQAARLAAFYLYKSLHKHFSVGGLVIEEQLEWYRTASDENQAQAFLKHISAESYPIPFDSQHIHLKDVLQQVQLHLKAGNILVLLSDFHDLDKGCESSLHRLARMHEVIACQISDPAEVALPASGRLSFLDESSGEICDLNTMDEEVRLAFIESAQKQQKEIMDRLRQSGCHYTTASTEQVLLDVLRQAIHG